MPVKKTIKKTKHLAKESFTPFKIFSDDHGKLQLIIIAFFALSVLLVTFVIRQQEEVSYYKQVLSSSATR